MFATIFPLKREPQGIYFLFDNFIFWNNPNCLDLRSISSCDSTARARTGHMFAQPSAGFLVCSEALGFSGSGMCLHQWQMKKKSRMEIATSGYKLNKEAQLLSEHYDLNTGMDPINLPSVGIHTLTTQVCPSWRQLPCKAEIQLTSKAPGEWKGSFPCPREQETSGPH